MSSLQCALGCGGSGFLLELIELDKNTTGRYSL
jgi:hypothetical protein